MKILARFLDTLLQYMCLSGVIGVLGFMLVFKRTEPWTWRAVGALIALLMMPFMLLTFIGLMASEGLEKIRSLRRK